MDQTPPTGSINFYDNFLPKLEAGAYTITVGTELEGQGVPKKLNLLDNDFQVTQPFLVAAPRFILPANEIHSVYPSAGIADFYDGVMPQVVFRNRVLPWERSLPYQPKSAPNPVPWMALLLLTEEQIIVPEEDKKAKGLLRTKGVSRSKSAFFKPPKEYLPPQIKSEPTDPEHFYTVDISVTDFKALCPLLAELPYLASVRQVNTEHKEFLGMEKEGWFSMLLSNRLSQTNYTPKNQPKERKAEAQEGHLFVRNIVHLVSLEGFGAYLDPKSAAYKNFKKGKNKGEWIIKKGEKAFDKIRLASLASWDYYCKPAEFTFDYLMKNLNVGMLQSHHLETAKSKGKAYEYLANAMEGGYTPLKYYPRQGGETVAMYRGPLTPVIADSNPQQTEDIYLAGGSSMIYDQSKGIYDVSYAVAWQIGRLMGLSDSHFSRTLLTWKRKFNERIEKFLERYNLKNKEETHQLPPASAITKEMVSELMSASFSENQLLAGFGTQMKRIAKFYKQFNAGSKIQEELPTTQGTKFTGLLTPAQYQAASSKGENLSAAVANNLGLEVPIQNDER